MWPETNKPRSAVRPSLPARPAPVRQRPAPPISPRLAQPTPPKIPEQPTAEAIHEPKPKTVEVNVSLPSLPRLKSIKRLKAKLPRVPRKYIIIGCLIVVIGFASWVVGPYILRQRTILVNGGSGSKEIVASKITDRPDYPTVLPASKNIDSLGGWTRVSPPDKNPVFAYVDKIGTAPITVSQQPLPKEFKQDTADTVERFAKSYQATVRVTAGNTIAYIGTSAKGPQSVIFTKNDLLILIKSSVKIDTTKWGEYINSLK